MDLLAPAPLGPTAAPSSTGSAAVVTGGDVVAIAVGSSDGTSVLTVFTVATSTFFFFGFFLSFG